VNIKRKHLNLLYPYSYKKKQIEQISSIKANEKMQASTQEQFVGSASVSGLNKKKTRFTQKLNQKQFVYCLYHRQH
jgi:hypothetical protein